MANLIKKQAIPDLEQALTPLLLGQAVRAKRTQIGLRLEDAAALCGVAKQTLTNIEHGKASSKLSSILQVCEGLGIKLCIEPWIAEGEADDEWQ